MFQTYPSPILKLVALTPAALLGLVALGWSPDAHACSCMPPPAPGQAMADSKAVFEGKLVSQRTEMRALGAEGDASGGVELPINVATFEVLRVWKGDGITVGSTITIETAGDSAACGRDYSTATEWIVYAYDQDGKLADGLCTRTGPSDEAANDGDAAALDAAAKGDGAAAPTAGGAPPETEASKAGCSVDVDASGGSLGIVASLFLAGVLGIGRRRARGTRSFARSGAHQ